MERIGWAREQGALGDAVLLRGDPPELPRLLADQAGRFLRRHRHTGDEVDVHPAGSADLVLASLPAILLLGRRQEHTLQWHSRFSALEVLSAAATVLRPGGYLVTATSAAELEGSARDLGAETVSLCTQLGLAYWQHIVCLLVPIQNGKLKPRRRRHRRQQAWPAPPRVVHADVHVFRKPASSGRGAADEEPAEEWWR
ncbi:MAG: hypothetical protein KGJ43_07155 [Acidobacteriota bacterium]|nr:hypothetical protein [Acidobacteriota bacterium]